MKILQIISGRDINGALVYCQLLSARLAARGHSVTLLCREGSWIAAHPPARVAVVESSLKWLPGRELRRIKSLVRSGAFDLIHSHQSRAHNLAAALGHQTGIPTVATAHARLVQAHWRFHDRVLANSEATAGFLRRWHLVSPSRLSTVYCYADLGRFFDIGADRGRFVRGELHARDGRFLIGVVGEVVPRKGHRYLFAALPEIIREIPSARLVLIGRFHRTERLTRRLRMYQLQADLPRRVHWLGRRSNVQDYMAAMNVCVVPSIEEPLGLVAVEAQAAGVPVVATRTGGLPEIVRDGETGLLVPPRDPDAIAAAVIRLHREADLRSRIVEQARSSAATQFDPERLTDAVEAAYEELLRSHRPA